MNKMLGRQFSIAAHFPFQHHHLYPPTIFELLSIRSSVVEFSLLNNKLQQHMKHSSKNYWIHSPRFGITSSTFLKKIYIVNDAFHSQQMYYLSYYDLNCSTSSSLNFFDVDMVIFLLLLVAFFPYKDTSFGSICGRIFLL